MTVEMASRECGTPVATDTLSSIAKAARVLRALALAGDGDAGVTDLATFASLPKSTTHRVLAELMREDLVCRSDQRYRLGPGWFELQSALGSSEWHRLVDRAKNPLASLFERTGATVHFGVLDGERVLYLEKLTARGGTRVPTRVGSHMPATCTALGKVLLAHSSPDHIRSVLSGPLPVASRRSVALPNLLARQFVEIRRAGIAYDAEESQEGVFCVAAPVYANGRVVAAVSVTRIGANVTSRDDVLSVRRAASQICGWVAKAS